MILGLVSGSSVPFQTYCWVWSVFEIWGVACTVQYSVMVTIALEVDLRRVHSHWQPRFHLFSTFWRVHNSPFYSNVYQTHVSPVLNTWTKKQISGLFLWLKPTAVIHLPFSWKRFTETQLQTGTKQPDFLSHFNNHLSQQDTASKKLKGWLTIFWISLVPDSAFG